MPPMYLQQFVDGNMLSVTVPPNTNPASAMPPLTDPETRLARKRKHYYKDKSSEEVDENIEIDAESYHQSAPQEMDKVVYKFINKTFRRCLPKLKGFELAREYPKPSSSVVAVPILEYDIKGTLGKKVLRWPIFGHT